MRHRPNQTTMIASCALVVVVAATIAARKWAKRPVKVAYITIGTDGPRFSAVVFSRPINELPGFFNASDLIDFVLDDGCTVVLNQGVDPLILLATLAKNADTRFQVVHATSKRAGVSEDQQLDS